MASLPGAQELKGLHWPLFSYLCGERYPLRNEVSNVNDISYMNLCHIGLLNELVIVKNTMEVK